MSPKVALILSGCGTLDGSEAHEVSPICVSLSREGRTPVFYAPFTTIRWGVDHVTGDVTTSKRNVLIESARLSHGEIERLEDLDANDEQIEALIIPGGMGVLYNFSKFDNLQDDPLVDEEVIKVIQDFKNANKPIGCCSFSAVIVSLSLPHVQITLGGRGNDTEMYPYNASFYRILSLKGVTINETDIGDVYVDEDNKVVSTATFLYSAATFSQVADALAKLIHRVLRLSVLQTNC